MLEKYAPFLFAAAVACCLLPLASHAEVYPNGLVVSYLDVSVSPRASGVVQEVFMDEGDWVAAGDTLAALEARKEMLDMELSEREIEELHLSLDKMKQGTLPKELEKMEIDLKKAQLSRDKSKVELERTQRLYEQKAVSEKEVADAKNAYDVAALSVKSLRLGLELAKETPRKEDVLLQEIKITQKMTSQEQKKMALEKMTIVAPSDGFISKLYFAPGEYASAGSPFCDVINTDSLYVEVNLPLTEIKRIKVGAKAGVTVPAIGGATYPGRVVFVSPQVDPASRTFKIRVEIANPGRTIRPGLFATVSL